MTRNPNKAPRLWTCIPFHLHLNESSQVHFWVCSNTYDLVCTRLLAIHSFNTISIDFFRKYHQSDPVFPQPKERLAYFISIFSSVHPVPSMDNMSSTSIYNVTPPQKKNVHDDTYANHIDEPK